MPDAIGAPFYFGATFLCTALSTVKSSFMSFAKKLAVATIPLLILACSKQVCTEADGSKTTDTKITGTWQWVRTDGGLGNNIHETPLSTGTQIQLKLAADSTYTIYTNNVITSQGSYRMQTKTCIHDLTQKPLLHFSDPAGSNSSDRQIPRQTADGCHR